MQVATFLLLSVSALMISGCGGVSTVTPTAGQISLHGSAHGGQQPISGSTITLYSVDTNGLVSRLINPVVTDSTGQFDIDLDYPCPSLTTPMLITATGGNPGYTTTVNNTAISLAAYVGNCGDLLETPYIVIDEVTTVAYAAEYNDIQNAGTNAMLKAAFNRVANFADFTTGISPGPSQSSTSSDGSIPVVEINTLANITATCINSDGSISSSTPCGKLFAITGSPTNTLDALTNLEGSPTSYDSSGIFALATAIGPFQPALSIPPITWEITPEQPIVTSGQLSATPSAGMVGDSIVITSNNPSVTSSICPFTPPLAISFGGTDAAGSFSSYEITADVPAGAASGGSVVTTDGTCTFPFNVQDTPAYVLSSPTLSFGNQSTGTLSGAQAVTFTNNSGPDTTVLVGGFTISSTPTASFETISDNCSGATLTYGNSCTVSIIFAPSTTGAATGTMTFYVGGVNVTATVALSGTGT